MKVIAVLDFEHLDNGVFLNSFAQSLAQQNAERCIVLHADSEYTDRLIQTGMMREDARLRSIRDLNHRLIALFADNGVPTIGINGYQRSFISKKNEGEINLDQKYFNRLSDKVTLLLSTLVEHPDRKDPIAMPIATLADQLKQILDFDEVIVFSADDQDEFFVKDDISEVSIETISEEEKERWIPAEFHDASFSFRVMNTQQFGKLPSLKGTEIKSS